MYCSFLLLLLHQLVVISSMWLCRPSGRIWMEMVLVFLQLHFLVVSALDIGETKCDEKLGCFSNEYPYQSMTRPISQFPLRPEEINTRFLLLTKDNTDDYQILSARNLSTFNQSHFDCQKKTVFIIHGYLEKGDDPWLKTTCKSILRKEDVNCVCVDWRKGASDIITRAINNVQVVGAEIAFFINTTMKEYNCSLTKVHVIGHSLGGQVAGEAGKRRTGIEKITVLDAAGPCFSEETNEVVVDPSDAKFVVAIHTDSSVLGFGMKRLLGHMDFFPNGGERMTGCDGSQIMNVTQSMSLVGAARDIVLCSHVNSYYLFIESIHKPEGLMGYCASSYSSFTQGDGFPCTNGSCSLMGYYTHPQNASSCRVYYMTTGPRYDFGRYRYNVTVLTKGDTSTCKSITIGLYNSSDFHSDHEIYSGTVSRDNVYWGLIDSRCPPPVTRVTFVCETTFLLLFPSPNRGILADSVNVTSGIDGRQYKFCGGETNEEGTQTLEPCP